MTETACAKSGSPVGGPDWRARCASAMTEQQPIKKGILSSLMGLFGEEESEKGHEDLEDQDEAAKPSGQVVRESYEPGWYRVSAAQEAPPTERSEGARRWEPSPSAGHEQATEPEW